MTEPLLIEVNLSVKNLNEIKAKVTEVMDENDRLRAECDVLNRKFDMLKAALEEVSRVAFDALTLKY